MDWCTYSIIMSRISSGHFIVLFCVRSSDIFPNGYSVYVTSSTYISLCLRVISDRNDAFGDHPVRVSAL